MTTALHGLPVSRTVLFGSTCLAGIVLLVVPVVINTLLVFVVKATMKIGAWIVAESVLRWMLYAIALSLVLFAFSAFVGMFVGNPAAQLVFTYILHFLPLAVFAGLMALGQLFLLGFSADTDIPNWILELPMMTVMHEFAKPCGYYILLFCLLAIVFFVFAMLAYKKRPLEQAGDVVVFGWVKPVFKYGVSVCFAVAGFLYIAAISDMDTQENIIGNTVIAMLWALVGFCIAQMLIAKTWRIFSAGKEMLTVCVAIGILFVMYQSDITGFEQRVAAPEDVAYVELGGFYEYPESQIVLKEEESIRLVTELHRATVEKKGKISEGNYAIYLQINYVLKDGTTLKRAYSAEASPQLRAIYNRREAVRSGHFMLYDGADRIVSLRVHWDGEDYFINDKETLLAALRTDVEAMQYEPWGGDYIRIGTNEKGIVSTVEAQPEFNLEIEMLPDAEEADIYYNGYRHYYYIELTAAETPNAYAVLQAQLPEIKPAQQE